VARVHGLTMVAFLAVTLAVLRMAHQGEAGPRVAQRLHELLVVLVGQAAIGYWQYLTGIPALLVAFHVLGATLVWIAVLRVWLSLHAPAPAPAGTARPAAAAPAGRGAPDVTDATAGAPAATT
jgi:heme a synthase